MNDVEVESLVKEMLNNSEHPSATVLKMYEFTNKHKSFASKKFNGFTLYFEHAFELLVDLVFAINYSPKKQYPKYRTPQIFLLKNNLGPLFSGFERSVSGFYDEGLILFRACYEAIIKVYFISFYPSDYEAVLVRKLPKGKRQFNLSNFVDTDLKVDWDFIYRLLSRYTHGNTAKTLLELLDLSRNGQTEPISFELMYNEDRFSTTMNMCNFIVWNYLKVFQELLVKPVESSFDPKLLKNLSDTEKVFGAMIKLTTNKFANTYDEVIQIFNKIAEREKSYSA